MIMVIILKNLYDMLLNISNNNIESIIKKSVAMARETLPNPDRMCILASNLVYNYLKDRHILCKIINTKELGMGYRHEFVLVKDADDTYLIDTTYPQFIKSGNLLDQELLDNGYIKLDNDILFNYLNSIPTPNDVSDVDIDELFLSSGKRK